MKFYTQSHRHYCGIDLHARSLYVCILNQDGAVLIHKDIKAHPEALLAISWQLMEGVQAAPRLTGVDTHKPADRDFCSHDCPIPSLAAA